MSGDFLSDMARSSRERVAAAMSACPSAALRDRALSIPAAPRLQRHPSGFDLITEVKQRSPGAGVLSSPRESLEGRVEAYAHAGAAAVSILTEPSRFEGSLEDLAAAARTLRGSAVSAMRKDFIVDPYQLLEARAAGAGGVLLILRMLAKSELEALLALAGELELFVLLEAFDGADIELMHELTESPRRFRCELLAGVNCRDLKTLEVVPRRLDELARLLPRSVPRVAESGVDTAAAAAHVAELGYELALVGTALMRSSAPGALAAQMLHAGRAARPGGHGQRGA